MSNTLAQENLLSIHEAATLLKVSTKTLRRWEEKGLLVPERTEGKHRRYRFETISNFKKNKPTKKIETPSKLAAVAINYKTVQEPKIKVITPEPTPVNTERYIPTYSPETITEQPRPAYTVISSTPKVAEKNNSKTEIAAVFFTAVMGLLSIAFLFKAEGGNIRKMFSGNADKTEVATAYSADKVLGDKSTLQELLFNINVPVDIKNKLTVEGDATVSGNLSVLGQTNTIAGELTLTDDRLSSTNDLTISPLGGAVRIGTTGNPTINMAGGDLFISDQLEVATSISLGVDTIADFSGTGLIVNNGSLEAALGTAIDSSEITNDTIQEVDLKVSNDGTTGQVLTYDSSTGGFTWKDDQAGDTSPFTTTGDVVNLVTSTNDLTIGSDSDLAKLGVDGDSDEIQLLVQGNSTQTANLAVFENSSGSDLVTIDNSGNIAIATGGDLSIGGIGLNDVGSSNITSGASLIGVFDEFNNSSSTNLQDILDDFDSAIGSGASKWTDTGSLTHLTDTTDDVAVGGTTLVSPFSVDVSANTARIGNASGSNGTLSLYASDGDTGDLSFNTSDQFQFSGGDVRVTGQLITGSTPVTITTALGAIDADAIGLISSDGTGSTGSGSGLETDTDRLGLIQGCSDGEILKWMESTSIWTCSSDAGSGGTGIINVQNNDVAVGTSVDTLDFSTDFTLTASPSNEANISVADDILNFSEFSDSLVLDAATSITAGSALSLTIGNNVTVTTTGTGSIVATDLVCTDCVTLATETSGSYVATITGNSQVAVSGSGAENAGVSLSLNANSIDTTQLAATLTFSDGDFLDLSAINTSSTSEGLKLPQNATACSAGTSEGQICWDSSTDTLYVGNGSTASAIGGGTSFTSFTAAGDSGGGQTISSGNTLTIAGGTNGIDTVDSATDTVTINLDTTEIGSTTFGSGSAFTWTFNASGGVDPTLAFGNNSATLTANTFSVASATTNADTISLLPQSSTATNSFTGTITSADLTAARTWTFPDDTGTICLTTGNCAGVGGGITGTGTTGQIAYFTGSGTIASEASGFAWDATNNKLGIGNDTPTGKLHVTGAVTGKALAIFDETGDQNILVASASGTTVATIDRNGQLTLNRTTANADKIALIGNNSGAATFTGTITNDDLTAARTWTLPDATGTVCLTTGNCAGVGGIGTMSSFTAAGDTGGGQSITDGNTLSIVGGTNGIDTVDSATDTVTINLDTTEIGSTTFGSGSAFTWTFDGSGGTDTTIAFGNDTQTFTTGTATFSGNATLQGTTGLTLSGTGADLTFANSESLTNDTNGQFNFKRNDAGTVTITAEDDNSTAALTILPGGAAAFGLGGSSTTAITLTTDSTGDAEVVLPNQSIGAAEVVTDSLTTTQLSSSLTFADGDFLDLSSINTSSTTEGLKLPQNASACSAGTAEGQICWDSSSDTLYVGNGSTASAIGGGSSFTSFTAAGDSGGGQSITTGNTLTIAGGTNGIDTVDSVTDTITLNLDTTEIGTTTFGSGSGITWTFDAGATDPTLAFASNQITIGSAATLSATGVTTLNCTDCIDFDDITDSATLDASTSIGFGSSTFGLTFTNNGSGDETHNLSSTGDFIIQDNGTPIASFLDTGAITFAPTSGTNFSTTVAGAGTINMTSATGAQTFTSSVVSGTTTSSAFAFIDNALTTGTEAYISSTSITQGKLLQLSSAANTLTTGTLLDATTTSTGLTTGKLASFDWSPGSAATATGDLFNINIGTNGTTTGNLFSVSDTGSNLFTVSEAAMTANVPANFTSAGDVSMAYDLQFTNQTSSSIKSKGPLIFDIGENYESNTATFQLWNAGGLVVDASSDQNTSTTGVMDININAGNAAVIGMNIDFVQDTGASSGTDAIAQNINLTANDADGDVFGTVITGNATTNAAAGSYEALIKVVNAENTASVVTDAILVDSTSGTDGDIVDALDVSDANITNAVNVGANTITGAGYLVTSTASGLTINSTSAALALTTTTSGNITITPAGTGDVVFTGDSDSDLQLTGLQSGTGSALCIDTGSSNKVVTCTVGSGGLSGSGTSGQIGFFNSSSNLTSETSGFGWDATNNIFTLSSVSGSTSTGGIANIDITAGDAAVNGIDLDFTQNDGATAGRDAIAQNITLTGNDADGDVFGIKLTGAATANAAAGTYEAGITIDNAENTAASMTDGILITSSGVNNGVTDAIDVSTANINNAINLGANFALFDGIRAFEGTTGTLTFEDTSGNDLITIVDQGTTGDLTATGDLTVSGGDIVSSATANLLNTTTTTLNFAGAATTLNVNDAAVTSTIDIGGVDNSGTNTINIATNGTAADTIAIGNTNASTTLALTGGDDWTISATGILTLSASASQTTAIVITDTDYTNALSLGDNNITGTTYTIASTVGDITLDSADEVVLGDTDTLIIGGHAGNVAYNVISNSGGAPSSGQILDDNDLYVQGNLEIDGTIYANGGTVTSTGDITISNADPLITFDDTTPEDDYTLGNDANAFNLIDTTDSRTELSFVGNGSIDLGDNTATKSIEIGGVTASAADTIRIATNSTAADTILIGNSNASTTVDITGGDDYTLAGTGVFTLSASASQTTALVVTDTDYTNFASIGDNNLIGTTAAIDFSNFDVATTGNITVAAGQGIDTNASGILAVGNTTATTVNIGGTAATAINIGAGGSLTRTIAIGTGTGADTINIGTGGTGADAITIGNSASTTALNFTSGTGTQTFTSSVATGTTTTSAFVFTDSALNSGTLGYLTSSSITTGKLLDINTGSANTFTSGNLLNIASTATSLTSGRLGSLDWSPGSTTTATGDLFRLNIGTNGSTTGYLFDITDTGTSVFGVSETQITSAVPHQFTAAGDVSVAYDLQFSNQTASYIKSNAPLYIETGESFESNNMTLRTFNSGNVIVDLGATAGKMSIGAAISPVGLLHVSDTGTGAIGKSLAIFDQDETQPVLTASASGTTIMTLMGGSGGDLIMGADGVNTAANIGGNGILAYGAICADDSLDNADDCIDAARSAGTVYGITSSFTIDDIAENFPTADNNLEAHDIVSLDYKEAPQGADSAHYETEFVKKAPQSENSNILGIISEKPGVLLGGWKQDRDPRSVKEVAVALSGRVPAKVNTQNGNIAPGDFITTSNIPGVGMKSTSPNDSIVGKALDKYENSDTNATGTVLVFINTQWSRGAIAQAEAQSSVATDSAVLTEVNSRLTNLENNFSLKVNSSITASDSGILANFNKVDTSSLSVLGDATLSNTVINGKLNVGALTIDNTDQSINAVGTLKIQSLALGNVEIMGGLVSIDTSGNVVVNTITAQKYKVAGASAGTAILPQGTTEISVTSTAVSANSLIFVTAKKAVDYPLAVTAKLEGEGFTVSVSQANAADTEFDWWIVDKAN